MSNLIIKLIKFGIGFILFIPLYIGGSFFFPFIFPKIWLFQLVTEVIFFFYVILALSDSRYRPRFNIVLGAVIILTIALLITGFTGIDAYRSFWGNTERMSGTVAWLHFVAFAVILSGILRTQKEWRNFFGIAVIVSVLEFFYVLAQYFGASWVWLPGSQIGTIGNTDLLGTYAIFNAFFALYLWRNNTNTRMNANDTNKYSRYSYVDSYHSYYNWLWATAFFLNIGTLFLASSRGAILGFGAGIIFYVFYGVLKNKEFRKIWIPAIVMLMVVYGAFFLARNTDFVKNNRQLNRITNISLQDDTVQQRFTEWGIAWNAFKARPIFGFGPNNYLYLHNAFLDPRVYVLRETNFDRAHNAYLDYASMSGILGLFGYLFLIAVLFWVFWKNNLWTWVSLIAAYAVQSFFVFDSPASYIALFLTIGFAAFTETSSKQKAVVDKQAMAFSSQVVIALSIFYFLFSIFIFWQVSIKPAVANFNFVKGYNGIETGLAPETAFEMYKKSLEYETLGTTEFRNQYINWLQKYLNNFKPENRLEILDFGIDELVKENKDHPMVFSYLNLGQLYNYKARGIQDAPNEKQEFLNLAANAYDKAIELSPKRQEVYYSYLQLYFDTKEHQKAVELMEKVVDFAPDYYQNWWYLGFAYTNAGDDKAAVLAMNRALALKYRPVAFLENGRLKYNLGELLKVVNAFAPKMEILGAVNPYIRLKMWPELLVLYLSIGVQDSNNPQIHQSLALVYQNLGLTDKVNEELKIIDNLQKTK